MLNLDSIAEAYMEEETILVIDNLITASGKDALSAKQGKILNEKIQKIDTDIAKVATDADIDAIFSA